MPHRDPVKGKAKLTLTVTVETQKGHVTTDYTVTWLNPDKGVAYPAWRLTKADGESYDVALTPAGPTCECPDFIYCRGHQKKRCKHVASLAAVGLLRKGGEYGSVGGYEEPAEGTDSAGVAAAVGEQPPF